MSLHEDARAALGELFIIGIGGWGATDGSGYELSDDSSAFLSQAKIGGVILFAHNYESPAQVAELTNQIQECRGGGNPIWICTDHEGGRVQRFKKGFTLIPDAATIAATDSPKLVFKLAEMMGKELRAVGVNVNFSPVADINTNPKNPIIGSRAFGSDEETVTKMVTAMVRGHIMGGVQACVKHFPGHGDTTTDSHLTLPKVSTPANVLREREFKPFVRSFKSRCAMVMTAHILCPSLDPERPSTLSSKTLRELMRKEMRYSKLIISDDMEMKAITDHFGAEEAPRLAIEAGCDLLIYRSEAGARHAYESLGKALDAGKLPPEMVLEAAQRSQQIKQEFFEGKYEPVIVTEVASKVGTPEYAQIVERVKAEAKARTS